MKLKIGELATRTGLTVRALHHYDAIGLLSPSARSDAGYRLYKGSDITRLYQISALRKFGMSLADIAAYLNKPELPLCELVGQQITMLTRQIDQAQSLRTRLSQLHEQLLSGQQPELAGLLTTLEHMSMYEKYFTQDELKQMPMYGPSADVKAKWKALVASVCALMHSGATADHPQAQALAAQWMSLAVQGTAANPVLLAKLNTMHEQEAALRETTGITAEMMQFVVAAANETKAAIYRKYLTDDEFAFLRANIGKRAHEWPPLLAQVRQAMDGGAPADSARAQALARQWLELFRSFASDDPSMQAKVRHALNTEPDLTANGWVDGSMRDYVRTAIASLQSP